MPKLRALEVHRRRRPAAPRRRRPARRWSSSSPSRAGPGCSRRRPRRSPRPPSSIGHVGGGRVVQGAVGAARRTPSPLDRLAAAASRRPWTPLARHRPTPRSRRRPTRRSTTCRPPRRQSPQPARATRLAVAAVAASRRRSEVHGVSQRCAVGVTTDGAAPDQGAERLQRDDGAAGGHVVQAAPVGPVDQRRDHQRDQDLPQQGEAGRQRPRVAVLAHHAQPGRDLAERAAAERGEHRRLEDEDARARRSRPCSSPAQPSTPPSSRITTKVEANQSTTSARMRRAQVAVSTAAVSRGARRTPATVTPAARGPDRTSPVDTPEAQRGAREHLLHARNNRDTVEKLPPAYGALDRRDAPRRTECSRTATSCSSTSRTRASSWSTSASSTCPASSSTSRSRCRRSTRRLRRRPRLRRLLDPWLPGHQRVRHGAVPGPDDGVRRPVPRRQDAGPELLHPRPDHRRGLLPRPAQHRAQGAGLPRHDRHRGHGVLRPGGGVLHLRLGPLLDRRQRGLLPHRLGRGLVELRARRTTTAATRPASRAATSRSRRTTTTATCATRW